MLQITCCYSLFGLFENKFSIFNFRSYISCKLKYQYILFKNIGECAYSVFSGGFSIFKKLSLFNGGKMTNYQKIKQENFTQPWGLGPPVTLWIQVVLWKHHQIIPILVETPLKLSCDVNYSDNISSKGTTEMLTQHTSERSVYIQYSYNYYHVLYLPNQKTRLCETKLSSRALKRVKKGYPTGKQLVSTYSRSLLRTSNQEWIKMGIKYFVIAASFWMTSSRALKDLRYKTKKKKMFKQRA